MVMAMQYSAGGVVIGPTGRVAVVSQGNSWSLPKGHIDNGEDAEQAARREVYEESGIESVEIIEKLGEYRRPRIGLDGVSESKDEMRHITIFLCSTDQHELQPKDPDNPEARWVDVEKVTELLSAKKDKEFFESVKPRIQNFLRQMA